MHRDPAPGCFGFALWRVGARGRPEIIATIYAPDLATAKAHFGDRGRLLIVSSVASLKVMGPMPVPEREDRYGRRPVRTPRIPVRPSANRPDFRARRVG